MRRSPLKRGLAAVSLFFVLAMAMAEAIALVHSFDFDAHGAGDSCKICISVAGLGAGAPAKSAPSILPCSDAGPAGGPRHTAPALRAERPSARGPPDLS